MKQLHLSVFLLISAYIQAQSYSGSCLIKVAQAIEQIYGNDLILQEVEKGYESLKKEADNGCPEALFQLGYLYYQSDYDYRISDKEQFQKVYAVFNTPEKAFTYLKAASDKGNIQALSYLGDLYRKGIGCELSYDKALELYEEAYNLGDQKSGYNIGYCYFKGLGSVDQNYEKAINWFKKSDYSMAKHWLAICYYFGYGIEVDREKTLDLLSSSEGNLNSPTLLAHLEELSAGEPEGLLTPVDTEEEEAHNNEVEAILTADEDSFDHQVQIAELSLENLKGDWQGQLLDMDFSGEKIMRNFPATFSFSRDDRTGRVSYTSNINNIENSGIAITLDETLYFEDFNIELPRLYKDHPKISNFNYNLLSASLQLKRIDDTTFLTAFVETKNTTTDEPGSPKLLVLTSDKLMTENGIEISNEVLDALLDQQGDNFITLYPNPFVDDLLIQYDLETPAVTSVDIYSLDFNFQDRIKNSEQQNIGKKVYHYNGSNLRKGLYVVRVITNGKEYTKLIAKK